MKLLTEKDRIRYARNIAIEDMGEAGQRKLLDAKVLVVGCGALGSVVCTGLKTQDFIRVPYWLKGLGRSILMSR